MNQDDKLNTPTMDIFDKIHEQNDETFLIRKAKRNMQQLDILLCVPECVNNKLILHKIADTMLALEPLILKFDNNYEWAKIYKNKLKELDDEMV